MKKEHMIWLQENYACPPGVIWIQEHNIKSLQEAWNVCNRGEWLLWMAAKLDVDYRKLVLCGALCAHAVVQHMKDPRSREAVRVAFLWGRGKATDEELEAARAAARAAAARATTGWAADEAPRIARWAAADAIRPTSLSAMSASQSAAAAAAADAWARSTDADEATDAREANRLRTANIARKVLTEDVMSAIQTIN